MSFTSEKMVRKGRSKLDIVKEIYRHLEKNNQVLISSFTDIGISNKTAEEYIDLINFILDKKKKISLVQTGKIKVIKLEN